MNKKIKIDLTCNYCNQNYQVPPNRQYRSKYCSKNCQYQHYKTKYSGNKNPMYGKQRPDTVEMNKTQKHSEAIKKAATGRKNIFLSQRNKTNLNPFYTGNPKAHTKINWTPFKLRKYIFQRDNYTCQECLQKKPNLEIHHIIPRRDGGTNEESNLKTLCFPCHRKVDYQIIKSQKKAFKEVISMLNGGVKK